MTKITQVLNSLFRGESADGRVYYFSENDGPKIDGRQTWRGRYVGTNGIATDELVSDADWAAACVVMADVRAAVSAYSDELRDAAEVTLARREAALEGIEAVKGGAYDPNAY